MTGEDFSAGAARALARELPGFLAVRECARLSGGASQESYRLEVDTVDGPLTSPCGARRAARRIPKGWSRLARALKRG